MNCSVERTYDLDKIQKAVSLYSKELKGFDPDEWIANEKNVALTNSEGDIALFEDLNGVPETVSGHYFFFSRGKNAVKAASEFLDEIFSDKYEVSTIYGLTPIEHKGALWLNKQLGFSEINKARLENDVFQFVSLTKKEWEDKK